MTIPIDTVELENPLTMYKDGLKFNCYFKDDKNHLFCYYEDDKEFLYVFKEGDLNSELKEKIDIVLEQEDEE